ncbi:serine/threonine-protein kinase PCRK1-like [Bidens hawaiensis]|uniref:serine/threonine-protein kinase PCRK1-like n=1 Tax=Bidens hawaiensis TaxID=980011 RepID=UPI0040496555
MVFHFRCFSLVTAQDEGPPLSIENFFTADSAFDLRQSGSASAPQREYITNPNVRSSNLTVFSLADLIKATNNFDKSSKIGEGGYGIVHKGVIKSLENPTDDICVAVKQGKRGQRGYRQWETEVNILGDIMHHNLVKLIGYCDDQNDWLLVYEYMPNGSVDDHLSADSETPLSWNRRLEIALDAAIGLTYLHEGMGGGSQGIIFRDFKPSNSLLDKDWNAKLSDFGFAREGPQEGQTHVSTSVLGGTKGYAAPEYVQTGRLRFSIDVWSYGVFLEELITGRRPIVKKTSVEKDPECTSWICCYAGAGKSKLTVDPRLEGTYSERSMQKMCFVAEKCLVKDPRKRPTMSQVLQMVREAIASESQQPVNGGRI